MTDRASTLVEARRERLERILGKSLKPPRGSAGDPLTSEAREYLAEEAQNLYWNDLEWERITDEEALEQGPIAQLAFPGFLAFIRGLLLQEVMPDSQAPASPRPQVVEDVLSFLARRVVELEDELASAEPDEAESKRTALDLTSQLVDLVLYQFHGVGPQDVERIEAAT
jgi:hypothetical protein